MSKPPAIFWVLLLAMGVILATFQLLIPGDGQDPPASNPGPTASATATRENAPPTPTPTATPVSTGTPAADVVPTATPIPQDLSVYERVLDILGPDGTVLPLVELRPGGFGEFRSTFTTVGAAEATFTWSEPPRAFDTPPAIQGNVPVVTFNGKDEMALTPDSDYWSRGDGSSDQAFSVGLWINPSGIGTLLSKYGPTGGGQWFVEISTSSRPQITAFDQSAGVMAARVGRDTVPFNRWTFLLFRYNGVGGPRAMLGVEIFVNGTPVELGRANNPSYVSMEDTDQMVALGVRGANSMFFTGQMAGGHCGPIFTGKYLSYSEVAKLYDLCGGLLGIEVQDINLCNVPTVASTTGARAAGIAGGDVGSPSRFTIAVLPDTQFYAASHPEIFTSQTQWIADQKDLNNIVFVLHEGDIINETKSKQKQSGEWQNASESVSVLDGVVPYALAVGNHDKSRDDTSEFNTYFPVGRYEDLPTFGGVFELGKLDNSFHLFSAGGTDWLVLTLRVFPPDPILAWANQVVAAHPNRRVILVTHTYLYSDDTLHTSGFHPYIPPNVNGGCQMWDKLVRRHDNMSFVFNGHILNDGTGRLVSIGDNGNKVYQMLANYQMLENGGNGFLRLVEFDPEQKRVSVKTYSPYLDEYKTDPKNQFVFENVDLGPPE